MDLWDLIKVLVQRWYLTLPLFAVVVLATFGASNRIAPTFTASSTVIFVAPVGDVNLAAPQSNIWLQAGLSTTAQAVAATVQGPDVRRRLLSAGSSPSYSLVIGQRSTLATITASASSASVALDSANRVVDAAEADLLLKQAQVPSTNQITVRRLTGEGEVVATKDGVKRVVAATAASGALLATGLVLALDALLRRRGPKRVATAGPRKRARQAEQV